MSMNNNSAEKSKPKLSNQQKQILRKYVVFALMGIIFLGCMWLIFSPSADEKARLEQKMGFNTDIPMPKNESIIGDKRVAYEQEQLKQRQAERMRSLNDFNSLLNENGKKQSGEIELLTDEPQSLKTGEAGLSRPKSSGVQSSMDAYHDVNRTLGSFYEKPREDPEKEQLKQELEELKLRMDETDNRKKAMDTQVEMMEKSFQMVSKYLPSNSAVNQGVTVGQTTEKPEKSVSGKTMVVPVSGLVEQTVSALPQEMSTVDVIETLSRPRNLGFLTATAETSKERKNTILACVYCDQTVMDGKSVRLRLLEPMRAGRTFIGENTVLSGFAGIHGERLQITINSLEVNGNIIPVDITVYDTDGQRGIFIPNTSDINAAKEILANVGTSAGTSINLSNDATEQFVADMGRNVIQGVSQFAAKKLREVKVDLKAGYRVFLLPEGKINNQEASN